MRTTWCRKLHVSHALGLGGEWIEVRVRLSMGVRSLACRAEARSRMQASEGWRGVWDKSATSGGPPPRYALRATARQPSPGLPSRSSLANAGERMAERVGFEPTVEFPLHTLSKRAPSTTRTSLRLESTICERSNQFNATRCVKKTNVPRSDFFRSVYRTSACCRRQDCVTPQSRCPTYGFPHR